MRTGSEVRIDGLDYVRRNPFTYPGPFSLCTAASFKANTLGGLGIDFRTRDADGPVTSVRWNGAARFVNPGFPIWVLNRRLGYAAELRTHVF